MFTNMSDILSTLTLPFTEPFFVRALLAGLLLAIATATVGVFVVMRKMSFFGDAVAHFAFTGIALGFLLGIDPIVAAVMFSVLVALGIGFLEHRSALSSDTTIGVFFAASIAFGVFLIGLLKGYRPDLFQYLFGDILAITTNDLITAGMLVAVVLLLMFFAWSPLLAATLNRDLAKVYGIKVQRWEYVLLTLLAIVTAISIKTVGILLVTAMLIVPAAAAKNIARSTKSLWLITVALSLVSVVVGLLGSYYWNTASGPTIVLVSVLGFIFSLLW